ncbi:MAG TPA: DUF4340 domain-containing protein [Woeseiaceae bacterium]|nr:DUF4340 domain-containing protein [Woeseiaceae bacterium]
MSARTLKILGIAVVVLFAAVFLLDRQRNSSEEADELLFPDLKEQLDAVSEVTVTDADSEVTLAREGDRWVVPGKGGYDADTGALRDLLIAIAEARKVEQKTSNSEYYDRLGVQPPDEEGSTGILVETAGPGAAAFALILGDSVQREYRYARVPDEAQSWLIDRNPDVPDDAADWLVSEIVDIPSSRIQSVTITHGDGETIRLSKENEDAANFELEPIPEGRELSYPSVGNSVASAIGGLELEDVRAAGEGKEAGDAATATTVYKMFDGLQLTVESTTADDETWISLEAGAVPVEADEEAQAAAGENAQAAAEAPPDASSEAAGAAAQDGAAAEPETTEAAEESDSADAEAPDPAEQAEIINARVSGWEYRIPQYKANQLTRRWEDLLADPEPESAGE